MFYAITLLLEIMHIIEGVIGLTWQPANTCIENQMEFCAIYQRILCALCQQINQSMTNDMDVVFESFLNCHVYESGHSLDKIAI